MLNGANSEMWTVSSVGRALDSSPKGRLFESGTVHKTFWCQAL